MKPETRIGRAKEGPWPGGWRRRTSAHLGPLVFTIVILVLAIVFAIASDLLEGRPGRFPYAVALMTIALCLAELGRQVVVIRSGRGLSDGVADGAGDHSPRPGLSAKSGVALWFVLTISGVFLAGVLVTSFLAGAAYYRWIDNRTTIVALVAGLGLALALWVVFELLSGFSLYRGALR